MNDKMRVVIVEDHTNQRDFLKYLLSLHPDVEIVGSCEDTVSAWPYIESGNVDGVFLDIGIFGESDRAGLDLAIRIDRLALPRPPWMIFTTGRIEYAKEAIEVRPFGYLDKPLDDANVSRVLNRVRLEHAKRSTSTTPSNGVWINGCYKDRGETIRFQRYLTEDEIVYVEANNGNSIVHLAQGQIVSGISMSLRDWENNVDLPTLMRIHRRHIVNVCYVDGTKTDPFKVEGHRATIRGGHTELSVSDESLQELRLRIRNCPKRLSLGKDFQYQ